MGEDCVEMRVGGRASEVRVHGGAKERETAEYSVSVAAGWG